MNLMIDRVQRDSLHALMTYRFFIGDDRRLHRAVEQGVTHEQLARGFEEDAQLMQDLGWLDQELAEALGMPDADRAEFELTMPAEVLASTLKRAREEARVGLKRTPTETEEEHRARFRVAEQTCDELLTRLGHQEEAPA